MTGYVVLVGAGPGDPGLITLNGLAAIKKADVLIYDRLVSPTLLRYAKQDVEKIYVGKGPEQHPISQTEINHLLVQRAKEGKNVVRLKGGDPYVFGRGGEEAQRLVAERIPFEVIPGISSAIAVPAYAGIPVTHRDFGSSFAVITGHECTKMQSSIDWAHVAKGVETLVFLMGMKNLSFIVKQLIEHGRDPSTPIALIRWGTLGGQAVLIGTLADIMEKVQTKQFCAPATIVIGEVVKLRQELNWFEKKPLFGQRILVTRTENQMSQLSTKIHDLGGEAIEFPVIQITAPKKIQPLDDALQRLAEFDWLIFTSVNGVHYFFQRLRQKKIDIRILSSDTKLVAVGEKTAAALMAKGLIADFIPKSYYAESLLETLHPYIRKGEKVLLPRSNIARLLLPEQLAKWGLQVTAVDAYDTSITNEDASWVVEQLREKSIDTITFTSSSTVRNLIQLLQKVTDQSIQLLKNCKIACIGPITARTAHELGLNVDMVAEPFTIEGLVDALQKMQK